MSIPVLQAEDLARRAKAELALNCGESGATVDEIVDRAAERAKPFLDFEALEGLSFDKIFFETGRRLYIAFNVVCQQEAKIWWLERQLAEARGERVPPIQLHKITPGGGSRN
jgi:hypothetical protein